MFLYGVLERSKEKHQIQDQHRQEFVLSKYDTRFSLCCIRLLASTLFLDASDY